MMGPQLEGPHQMARCMNVLRSPRRWSPGSGWNAKGFSPGDERVDYGIKALGDLKNELSNAKIDQKQLGWVTLTYLNYF